MLVRKENDNEYGWAQKVRSLVKTCPRESSSELTCILMEGSVVMLIKFSRRYSVFIWSSLCKFHVYFLLYIINLQVVVIRYGIQLYAGQWPLTGKI